MASLPKRPADIHRNWDALALLLALAIGVPFLWRLLS